jgi:hypothetical protein
MFPIAPHFVQYALPNIILLEPTYENIMGTQEKKFPSSHHPTLHLKSKKDEPLGCMFSRLLGSMHILFLDMVATIFLPQV